MEKKYSICVGDILKNGNKQERVIHVDDLYLVTVDLNTNSLRFNQYKPLEAIVALKNNSIQIEREENTIVINYDSLPEKYKQEYDKNLETVNNFCLTYGPYYETFGNRGNGVKSLAKAANLSTPTYLYKIRRYFQSGCSEYSLYSQRTPGLSDNNKEYVYSKKTGRPNKYTSHNCILDDTLKTHFKEGLNELLSGGRCLSMVNAYDHIIQKYYTKYEVKENMVTAIEENQSNLPSYRQFYYYIKKNTTKEQFDILKSSTAEVRNDKRLLLSDSKHGVYGIGDLVEVDACEVDVSIVDKYNTEQSISRPILYCMIDVATRVILAVSVAFENNSVLGLTNLLLNLTDDKVEYCKRYGINLEDSTIWPSCIIPRRIRFDRGAECTSKKAERLFNKLGIERQLVTGGTGSLKGNIEQSFHQLHLAQNYILENHGLIEKRHDSKHHKEAVLTIEEYTKMVINFVLAHNQTTLKGYKLSKDMIAKGVAPIPVYLWNYWAKKSGLPRQISSKNIAQIRFDLMEEYAAKLDRQGIHFIGDHLYYNENDADLANDMYEAGDNKILFKVRYDPRNANFIYYIRNNTLYQATMNLNKSVNDGFENLTVDELKSLDRKRKQIIYSASTTSEQVRRLRDSANQELVANAIREHGNTYSDDSNMKINREIAKQEERFDNSITSRFMTNQLIGKQSASTSNNVDVFDSHQITQSIESSKTQKNINIDDMTPEEFEEYEKQLMKEINKL